MKKKAAKKVSAALAPRVAPAVRQSSHESAFEEVVSLIEQSRIHASQAVNTVLIDLYWRVGEYVWFKIQNEGWGKSTVLALATFVQRKRPGIRGFSPQNIWRMRQFFDAYRDQPNLSTLLRDLPWSSNLHILSRAKRPEEREFYLRMAIKNRWHVREVARQMNAGLFERSILNPPQLSTALRELQPLAAEFFKDIYTLEFLGLPTEHSEADLEGALLRNLGRFITELGRDFCFIGSQYPIQVGGQDFALDLLFFHRGMNCLVAIELKIREFRPEDLGKINFYLEALDRDSRKPHENPAVGLLLCATKDTEVVEYCLSRSLSPAMIAEYETLLPDKELLKAKLHEFYQLCAPPGDEADDDEVAISPAKPKRKTKGATP
jgi:predicted nuclease of restriction endonuclease-like (RecB) superfamily